MYNSISWSTSPSSPSSTASTPTSNMLTFSPLCYANFQNERYAPGSSTSPSPRHRGREGYLPPPPPPVGDLDPSERKEYDQFDLNETIMGDGIGDDPLFTFDDDSPPREFQARPSTPDALEQATAAAAAAIAGSSAPPSASSSSSRKRPGFPAQPPRRASPPSSHPYFRIYEAAGSEAGPLAHHHYAVGTRTPSRGPPGRPHYPGYSPNGRYPVDHSPWEGSFGGRPYPHQYDAGQQYYSDEDDSLPQLPPSSTKKRPLSPSQVGKHGLSTPEKMALDKARSPFRTPYHADGGSGKSNKPFRSSPFFQASPVGSFGMETPGGILASSSFSPNSQLPSFEMEDDGTIAFPLGEGFVGGGGLNISRSHSQDSDSSPLHRIGTRLPAQGRSPLSDYINDLSPAMRGGVRSPAPHRHAHQNPPPPAVTGGYPSDARGHSASAGSAAAARPKAPGAVTMSDRRPDAPSSRLDPGAKPKQLWPASAESSAGKAPKSGAPGTPGPVRLEIGSASLSKTFKAMNSRMLRPANDTTLPDRGAQTYSRTPTRRPPQQAPQPYHHSSHQGGMATPIKPYHSRPPPAGHHPYHHPSSANKPVYPPPSASKQGYHDSRGPPSKPLYMGHPIDGKAPSLHGGIPSPEGKENKKKATKERSLCNCKKSRCLKLYCECFAAELFCQGCNCVDCRNTPEAGIEREKAIKDTRAKNSKAFQTRFGVKEEPNGVAPQRIHNMGCKCKKSECLKKYCEVRLAVTSQES